MKASKLTPTQMLFVIQESQAETAVKKAMKSEMMITVFRLFLAMALYINTLFLGQDQYRRNGAVWERLCN